MQKLTELMQGEVKMVSTKMKFMHYFFATMITILIVGIFGAVWFQFYNYYAFDSLRLQGGMVTLIIYSIIYISFARLYKAYKIGANQIGETIFSQVLSFGVADILLYVECCLVYNRYVNIIPGLIAAALQIAGTAVWALVAKRYYIDCTVPSDTLVIWNTEHEIGDFTRKLSYKFHHMFVINDITTTKMPMEVLYKKIDASEAVILYELDNEMRESLMEYAIRRRKLLYVTPTITDVLMQGFESRHMVDTPLMKYEYGYERANNYVGKRALDLCFSLLGLIVFGPVMLLTALAVKLEDRGPVFFKQKRCTKDGEVFEILKFRSMIVDAEKDGVAIPCVSGDNRITRVGRFIRKLRLDELPQIFNVLRGEMAIVGPRPERVEHVEEYIKETPEFSYRMRVKGGLTGYAQIYGKYNTSSYDKLRLDMMYIENMSLILDLKLIFLTFKIMFIPESTEGFSEEKSQGMAKVSRRKGEKMPHSQEPVLHDSIMNKRVV